MFFGVRVFVNFALSLCSVVQLTVLQLLIIVIPTITTLKGHLIPIIRQKDWRGKKGKGLMYRWLYYKLQLHCWRFCCVSLNWFLSYYLRFEYHIFCHFVIKNENKSDMYSSAERTQLITFSRLWTLLILQNIWCGKRTGRLRENITHVLRILV